MTRPVLVALRVLLVALFATSIVAQLFAHTVAESALAPVPAVVVTAFAIAAIVCVEIVIVCVWMLLGMVRDQRIFEEHGHSDRWVNAAIGALATAAAIGAATLVYLLFARATETPAGLTIAILAAVTAGAGAALALLVVVMRQLLHTAIQLHSELAEVV
ncbi:DUF2975 domain-containing protein [Herbiconiux sp. P17]|uniref:DUF2975 domain-containing protein n=1 Tax=Herbiconiux wuyangfengii TaxID=3342794 RepID=UPI0035B6B2E3